MTQEQAEKIANVLIGGAMVGAAYFIFRDPAWRRAALRAVRTALAASGPWLIAQAKQAWAESGAPAGARPTAGRPAAPEERI